MVLKHEEKFKLYLLYFTDKSKEKCTQQLEKCPSNTVQQNGC